ncbi:MAG: alpha/beta fold hydrolase [Bacteroidota bacterium]
MPILQSQFQPAYRVFQNSHASTIYASLIRRWIPGVKFERERVHTPDGDFLDLDWSKRGSRKMILILAGLEGKSWSLYSRAAINYFNKKGWDALAMNYRGCSGEPNRLLRGYHMGATDDVKFVVEHVLNKYDYEEIVILGYSLGGNLALKYVGEESDNLPKAIKATVSFSVPMDIKRSDQRLNEWYNWHYLKWFMMPLNYKANRKKRQFPEALKSYRGFFMSGNFVYFDTYFTAPANGYDDVEAYWAASSCIPYLEKIKVPSLVVSSTDDTFISENCYPIEVAQSNPYLFLEMPVTGGHCGFIRKFHESSWWMEERALEFVESLDRKHQEAMPTKRKRNISL